MSFVVLLGNPRSQSWTHSAAIAAARTDAAGIDAKPTMGTPQRVERAQKIVSAVQGAVTAEVAR